MMKKANRAKEKKNIKETGKSICYTVFKDIGGEGGKYECLACAFEKEPKAKRTLKSADRTSNLWTHLKVHGKLPELLRSYKNRGLTGKDALERWKRSQAKSMAHARAGFVKMGFTNVQFPRDVCANFEGVQVRLLVQLLWWRT
jgi:hypothetical protein